MKVNQSDTKKYRPVKTKVNALFQVTTKVIYFCNVLNEDKHTRSGCVHDQCINTVNHDGRTGLSFLVSTHITRSMTYDGLTATTARQGTPPNCYLLPMYSCTPEWKVTVSFRFSSLSCTNQTLLQCPTWEYFYLVEK